MPTTMTELRTISVLEPADYAKAVAEATPVLARAGLVVAPTETRYGLLGSTARVNAIARICVAKDRSVSKPVAVFVGDMTDAQKLAVFTPAASRVAESLWPGPLTLVLEARVSWPAPLVVDGRIGLRMSSSPFLVALMKATGGPLTATSANLSGGPEAETVEEIQAVLGDRVDLYLDGGRLDGPVSTVVDLSGDVLRVLRDGAVPRAELEAVIGELGIG